MLATTVDSTFERTRSRAVGDKLARTIRYYDENALAYAEATLRIDTSAQLDRFASLLPAGGRVLDAGCGSGRDIARLTRRGFRTVGLDVSPDLAAIARRVSGGHVIVGDFRTLDLPRASFDGIWAMASLLHLDTHDLDDALAALSALLAPGGVIFASVKRGAGEIEDDTGRWFMLHDESGWRSRLREAGLQVIEVVGEPADPASGTGSVATGWISSLARKP